MSTNPEDLASGMTDFTQAVRSLDQLLHQMSHNGSQSRPTTEEVNEARSLLAAASDASEIVIANTEAAT
jgi:hypothetical protein